MKEYDGLVDLYIKYDYLPVEQHNRINDALNGVYTSLAQLRRPDWPDVEFWLYFRRINREYFHYGDHFYTVPLCLTSVHTGESIRLKFDVERKIFPKLTLKDGELEVFIPSWSAVLVVAAAILKGGMGMYGEFLEVQKKDLELDKIQLEIQKLKSQLEEETATENSPAINSIERNIQLFKQEINQPNIKRVEIDGVVVKNLTRQ